jgi:uncharacterized membrane protein YhhN
MMNLMVIGIVLCLLFGALAIFGGETGRKTLVRVGKPLATLSLLLIVGFPPWDRFQTLVVVGILFSLAGDVALLGDGDREFLIGTVAFLIAHVCYIIAFIGAVPAGGVGAYASPATAVVLAASVTLVALLWPKAGVMRGPIVVYAAAITTMVSSAIACARVIAPQAAAMGVGAGAVLFYLSDASLAWNRFRSPFRHSQLVILATYWLGQIGIALAARLHG